jgi:murein DD-endopeptidase MepM/ murein hydrolase activator NlpD
MARYFVLNPTDGTPGWFWRRRASFAGHPVHINLNLLAHAVGDVPADLLPASGTLVAPQDYRRFAENGPGAVLVPALQPFAYTTPGDDGTRPTGMSAGDRLRAFLDDPLRGEALELSLPFYDEDMKLGPAGGGFLRDSPNESAFHAATDFNTSPTSVFEVAAAASGEVHGLAGDCVVVAHPDAASARFLTVYLHVDLGSTPHDVGDRVRRGQFLARTDPTQSPLHLHFAVAVRAPGFTWNGLAIDPFWHMIDPWGVYDLRAGNYLPTTGPIFEAPIAGVEHTVHWRSQPVARTIPIARQTDPYHSIVRVQVRAREGTNRGGTLPAETDQFLVWLDDDPDFFLVPLSQAADHRTEWELATLLREAFLRGRPVRLEYRWVGDLRYVMAAWVRD